MDPNEKYTRPKGEIYDEPARPGEPLQPDELDKSPPEFQSSTQSERATPAAAPATHPTAALSANHARGSGKAGPIRSGGAHPTSTLDLRKKR